MNIDNIIFENYLDQLILEDTALIYESRMNGKINLVAKITLAISATTLLILVAKKIKKYAENKRDEEQIDSTISSLKKTQVELFKLKGEAKKVEKVKENEEKIADDDIRRTYDDLTVLGFKSVFGRTTDIMRAKTAEDLKKMKENHDYIEKELEKAKNRLYNIFEKNPNISKEDSEWVRSTIKDVENYMRGLLPDRE